MKTIPEAMKAYLETHPFDSGSDDCATVLDQLYQAYAESRESDPPEIREGFKELEEFLHTLPLRDNNAVCNLCCLRTQDLFVSFFVWCLLYSRNWTENNIVINDLLNQA